jgi:hypothetical protein
MSMMSPLAPTTRVNVEVAVDDRTVVVAVDIDPAYDVDTLTMDWYLVDIALG